MPLTSFETDEARELGEEWKALSYAGYAQYLCKTDRGPDAVRLLEEAAQRAPSLAARPIFQSALANARAQR